MSVKRLLNALTTSGRSVPADARRLLANGTLFSLHYLGLIIWRIFLNSIYKPRPFKQHRKRGALSKSLKHSNRRQPRCRRTVVTQQTANFQPVIWVVWDCGQTHTHTHKLFQPNDVFTDLSLLAFLRCALPNGLVAEYTALSNTSKCIRLPSAEFA